MIEVFRIWPDLDYIQFAPEFLSPLDIAHFAAGRKEAFGNPVPKLEPPIRLRLGRARDGTMGGRVPSDCVSFTGQCLLLSDRAKEQLHDFFTPSGYFLPTEQQDIAIKYHLYICQVELEALDENLSEVTRLANGSIFAIDSYAFIPHVLAGHDVFRLPGRGEILVSRRVVDVAADAHLSGFVFQKVWSQQTGPVERPGYPHRGPNAVWRKQIVAKTEARRAYLQSIGYPMEELTGKLDLR